MRVIRGIQSTGLVLGVAAAAFLGGCRGGGNESEKAKQPPEAVEAPNPVKESLAEIVASAAKVEGEVQIRRRGSDAWEPAAVGAALRTGDTVRTGESSFARIRFSKGRFIDLDASTSVVIDLARAEGEKDGVVVAIEQGSVAGAVDQAADAEQPLYIDTGDGSRARLRPAADAEGPTEFRVRRGKDKTEIAARKGRLRVSAGGKESELAEGTSADVTSGGLGDAISLIAFPTSVSPGIDARYHYQDGMHVELEWKPVDQASGYRVQVARDLSFHQLVTSLEIGNSSFEFAPQQAGMYTWRVASRDADGRPGEFGFARRVFCEVDTPEDLLVGPPDGARLAYTKDKPELTFSWQTAGGATSYRLAVSRGSDPLDDPVVDKLTQEQSLTVDNLGEGRYIWGVYAVGEVSKPLFLRPRRLVIDQRKAPKADTKDLWD